MALADQQVVGLVMWIPAGIPLTLVALILDRLNLLLLRTHRAGEPAARY